MTDNNLLLIAEGIQGKGMKRLGNKSCVTININDNCSIHIDNYVGSGETFKKRKEPLFNIIVDSKIVSLSLSEFIEKIQK